MHRKLAFPMYRKKMLFNMGITRDILTINENVLSTLTLKGATENDNIQSLCEQLSRIYRHVSMRVSWTAFQTAQLSPPTKV
jgi:hypothetical protein